MNDVQTSTPAEAASATFEHPDRTHRPHLRWLIAGGVLLVAVALIAVAVSGGFGKPKPAASTNPDSTTLQPVTRQSLSSQTEVSATLGHAGSYTVVVPSGGGSQTSLGSVGATAPGGVFTALPAIGQVVSEGQSIYSIDGTPTVLLDGPTPAYRALSEGMSGSDVRQLNADLVALGDATRADLDPSSDYFSAASAAGIEKLQAHLGVSQTGSFSLGQVVFVRSATRVTAISAVLGAPAQPGSPVLQATSTTREVIVQLDATQQSEVKVGDRVTITLPDNATTPGVVTSVGTVATSPSSNGGGSSSAGSGSSTPTIEVDVTPTDPAATGSLDQAPVTVTITTATVNNALVVPVDALLAQSSGGYSVEIAGAGGSRHLVPVSLGLFDQADGLVQVTGRGLSAGQQVVVPRI